MLASTAHFLDDAAALEKTLRLLQGICTFIAGSTALLETAAPWAQARSQLALGEPRLKSMNVVYRAHLLNFFGCRSSILPPPEMAFMLGISLSVLE